ncbi:keratin [Glaciimonas immobilis]|uniref:Uncharacterized protein n=1 Tax=Glaciimonas immobilis TaxID=728004 RepID=A0A840RYL2_9BURK|nr:keratin [Glaciimonas immobilis]KAF3995919.1 keratin [Glaciimonas immobilis]MBB5202633.1 hypothetical protein [Glaciimonas immobilis]
MTRYTNLVKSRVVVLLFIGALPFFSLHASAQSTPDSGQKMFGTDVQRETYLRSTRQQIADLRNDIEALNAKAKRSASETKARLELLVRGYRRNLRDIDNQWTDLKNRKMSKWQDGKNVLEASIKKLRAAVDSNKQ